MSSRVAHGPVTAWTSVQSAPYGGRRKFQALSVPTALSTIHPMRIDWSDHFRLELCRIEAEARAMLPRLRRIASLREEDGLDSVEAELDAAEQLGLFKDLDAAVTEPLSVLDELEAESPVETVHVRGSRAAQPTLKRQVPDVELTLPPSEFRTIRATIAVLAGAFVDSPERTAATHAIGLGGSGGCATGECLPEDAPAGPLFDRPN